MSNPKILVGAVLLVGLGLGVGACGGETTVSSDNSGTQVRSAQKTPTPAGSSSATVTPPHSGAKGGTVAREGSAQAGVNNSHSSAGNEAIAEVTELPSNVNPRTEQDEKYLAELKDNDIDVEGSTEDQLIAAAHEHCFALSQQKEGFAIPVAAGQLSAQEKISMSPEKAAEIIAKAAKTAYC